MKNKLIISGGIILLALFTGGYLLLNQSHRNIQELDPDFTISVASLVNDYLVNPTKANTKYLAADGQSKILVLEGNINSISKSSNGRLIIILKDVSQKVGIQCLFLSKQNFNKAKVGDQIKIKGVLRAGPAMMMI